MANHSMIPLNKKTTNVELKNVVEEILNRRFRGYLKLNFEKGEETFWVSIKEPKIDINGYNEFALFWINDDGNIEFRHCSGDESWWIELILEKELAKHYGVKRMYDDGIGWYDIDFDRDNPTYRHSVERGYNHLRKKSGKLPFTFRRHIDWKVKQATEISEVFGDKDG